MISGYLQISENARWASRSEYEKLVGSYFFKKKVLSPNQENY